MTKYLFIDSQKALFPIYLLLAVLGVNKSSYYYWNSIGRINYQRRVDNEAKLVDKMREIHDDSRQSYGAPRMVLELASRGVNTSKRRVAEVMAKHRIQGLCGRVGGPRTTIPAAVKRAYPDLLKQKFTAAKPDTIWYGDITYIRVGDRFWYLATVIDACTREVVGWSLADHMRTSLVTDALRHAIRRRGGRLERKVVFHSDRGTQYMSDDMHKFCRANNIWQSMGRKGTCYDNAAAESFFSTIKRELIDRREWPDGRVLEFEVFEWIEDWYNSRRRHSTIGGIAPEDAYRRFFKLAA